MYYGFMIELWFLQNHNKMILQSQCNSLGMWKILCKQLIFERTLSINNNPLHDKLVCEKYEINFCTCFLYKNNHASRSSRPEVFCKKGVLRTSQNSQGKTCAGVSFLVSSYEFCEISKNTFFHRTPLVAASKLPMNIG